MKFGLNDLAWMAGLTLVIWLIFYFAGMPLRADDTFVAVAISAAMVFAGKVFWGLIKGKAAK